jgi:hypothetical protein
LPAAFPASPYPRHFQMAKAWEFSGHRAKRDKSKVGFW